MRCGWRGWLSSSLSWGAPGGRQGCGRRNCGGFWSAPFTRWRSTCAGSSSRQGWACARPVDGHRFCGGCWLWPSWGRLTSAGGTSPETDFSPFSEGALPVPLRGTIHPCGALPQCCTWNVSGKPLCDTPGTFRPAVAASSPALTPAPISRRERKTTAEFSGGACRSETFARILG